MRTPFNGVACPEEEGKQVREPEKDSGGLEGALRFHRKDGKGDGGVGKAGPSEV